MGDEPGLHVTLVVPGLFGPAPPDGARREEASRLLCERLSLPCLERFFSRATATPSACPGHGLAALLFGCFGVAREGPDWPVAAVTRRLDAVGAERGWVLRADPAHLRVDMGELALLDSDALRISMEEAEAFATEINAQLDEPRVRLEALAAKRWYICLDSAPRLATQAPWEVSGARIGAHLPRGDDAGRWQALSNAIQMILHASPVNRAREGRGDPAINSVWLWGGGRTPKVPAGQWQGVCSDDALVAGLAELAGMAHEALPEDGRAWLARERASGHYLLVSSAAYVPVRCSDVDTWRSFVSEVEGRWMRPLMDALEGDRVQSVSLRSGGPWDFRLARRELGRWWRRSRPFARIMSESR